MRERDNRERDNIAETDRESGIACVTPPSLESSRVNRLSETGDSMWYFAVVSALLVVSMLANPCGAQAPPPVPTLPPDQNQAVQIPEAEPGTGVSGQVNIGPTSVPTRGVGSTRSSSVVKRFGSAGQRLPGMPGGPPVKGSMGYQDPSSRYMRPPVIPPVLCDPAVNIPC